MAKERAAVLGTGQTHYRAKRQDVSMAGLLREAIDRAMADAHVGWDDIDAVVVGKAPDFFEGVMMPELFLADALGAVGKPLLRVHTAGSVGGSTAYRRREPRAGRRARAGARRGVGEAVGVQRDVGAVDPDPVQHAGQRRRRRLLRPARALATSAAPGRPTHIGAIVAAKDRRNGAKNPYAHLQQADITVEKVQASQMLWDPIRYDETCPSSDGACAIVIGNEKAARRSTGRPGSTRPRCARSRRPTPAATR